MSVIPSCILLLHRSVFFMKAVASLDGEVEVIQYVKYVGQICQLRVSKKCALLGFLSLINSAISLRSSNTCCKALLYDSHCTIVVRHAERPCSSKGLQTDVTAVPLT